MDQVVPWDRLLGLIEPHYPKGGNGRPQYPLATMLRIHLMQNWFGYSDPAMEEALHEVTPVRRCARLSAMGALLQKRVENRHRWARERRNRVYKDTLSTISPPSA